MLFLINVHVSRKQNLVTSKCIGNHTLDTATGETNEIDGEMSYSGTGAIGTIYGPSTRWYMHLARNRDIWRYHAWAFILQMTTRQQQQQQHIGICRLQLYRSPLPVNAHECTHSLALIFGTLWRPRTNEKTKNKRSPQGNSKDWGSPQGILCTKSIGVS